MTDDQKREIIERVARNVRGFGYFDGTLDITEEVLDAANHFELRESYVWERQTRIEAEAKVAKLREAVEKAVTELAARARIDNYPAVVADGYVVQMLRAALKGGGGE